MNLQYLYILFAECPSYHWGRLGSLLRRHWECMLEQLLHNQQGIQLLHAKKTKSQCVVHFLSII